jgi:hypothetical protein
LAACAVVAPGRAWAQPPTVLQYGPGYGGTTDAGFGAAGYAPPPYIPWSPLGSSRPEDGGLFLFGEAVMFRQTNPIQGQVVGVRGFIATDDTVPGVPPGSSGVFVGSRSEALNTSQVSGPSTYEPGFELGMGWKFKDGSALSFDVLYLFETQYRAVATAAAPGLNVGPTQADSFLTAFVFNFPPDFAGPTNKIAGASPLAAYGIWDAASVMTEVFEQRFQQWQMTYRVPVYDTECYRLSALVGPRFVWIWERYKWVTQSIGDTAGPDDAAVYTNIDSNRMYGVHAGCSNEWYIGRGFATRIDVEGALLLNSVKEREQYNLLVKLTGAENKRAIHRWTLVPEVQCFAGLQWYPTENVQLMVGYDVMAFFNTISSPRPIDFNYSSLTAPYESTARFFDGWRAGIAIHF